jgi:hypothetical protein
MRKLLAASVYGLLVATSCREPTAVFVEVTTNVGYRAGATTSFTVGEPGATELGVPTTVTAAPWGSDGFVGTLTVVPGSADDAMLSVKVVMGIDRDPRDCSIGNPEGCIIARRLIKYRPHERLVLPLPMFARCAGIACNPDTTCDARGQCVATAVDPSTCEGGGCRLPGETPDGGIAASDGSAPEAGTDAAPIDGAKDAGPTSDPECGPVSGGAMAFVQAGISAYCIDRTEVTQGAYDAFLDKSLPKLAGCPSKGSLAPAQATAGQPPCTATSYAPQRTPGLPVVCVDHCDAATYCQSQGKELCSLQLWTNACASGAAGNAFPYGNTYRPMTCNGADFGALKSLPVGALPDCVTASKVFDMSGNVWEHVAGSIVGGGFHAGVGELSCRPSAIMPATEVNGEVGFRCCKPL